MIQPFRINQCRCRTTIYTPLTQSSTSGDRRLSASFDVDAITQNHLTQSVTQKPRSKKQDLTTHRIFMPPMSMLFKCSLRFSMVHTSVKPLWLTSWCAFGARILWIKLLKGLIDWRFLSVVLQNHSLQPQHYSFTKRQSSMTAPALHGL
jgi:hypothetical protein